MGCGPAQFFGTDLFVGHGFDHIGTGNEHIGSLFHHKNPIGDGRGIDSPSGTRPHDHRQLGNQTGGLDIAVKDIGIARQGGHAFLNAGPARIVQTHHRNPNAQGKVHELDDFFGMGFGQGASEDREVLGKNGDALTIHGAQTRNHPIPQIDLLLQTKISATMGYQPAHFFERTRVQQNLQALPRAQFAFAVLGLHAGGSSALHALDFLLLVGFKTFHMPRMLVKGAIGKGTH